MRFLNSRIAALLAVSLCWTSVLANAQDSEEAPPSSGEAESSFRLVVPLLEGNPAPFSGILMPEEDFRLAIELDAAADRWRNEARAFERQLETERRLYEEFIGEQRARINELSEYDWWDENGNWFMLGLGLILGVGVSALIVGLASN